MFCRNRENYCYTIRISQN